MKQKEEQGAYETQKTQKIIPKIFLLHKYQKVPRACEFFNQALISS